MENASKALIIAGAILLSILLISLGILIFNQAQDTVINNSGMSQTEVVAFNNKITKYTGKKQKGSAMKSLLQEVVANNAANRDNEKRRISVSGKATISNGGTSVSNDLIQTSKDYTIESIMYNDDGTIKSFEIKEAR